MDTGLGRRCTARWQPALYLIGCLSALACGSGGGNGPAQDSETDTGSSSDEPSDSPGNLPNLSTHSGDPQAEPDLPEEPADCAVQTLATCVSEALEQLQQCLAASHGGAFGEDRSSCVLSEGDATVTFAQPVPRWSTDFLLSFSVDVAGQSCASYAERAASGSIPSGIDLVTAQHTVTLETDAANQSTLTCDGVSVSYRQSNLSGCHEAKSAPSPELMDQTLSGVYEVAPRQQSSRRVFNCRFADAAP